MTISNGKGTLIGSPWPWDDVGDPVGVVRHPEYSEPAGLGMNLPSSRAHPFLDASIGDERDEKRQEGREKFMKESVRNSRRGLANTWLVVLGLVFLLTACTVEESDGPVKSDKAEEPAPSGEKKPRNPPRPSKATGRSLAWWTVWRANRGANAGPVTGRTLDVTDFGADPDPDSHDDAAAIRAALDAAEPGDEVVLPAGTYDLRSTDPDDKSANIVLRSGVDLRGEGQERTVLLTSLDGEDDSRVIRGSGVNDVIIADFTITSRHEGPLGDDPDDGDAGGGPMYGIHFGAQEGTGQLPGPGGEPGHPQVRAPRHLRQGQP